MYTPFCFAYLFVIHEVSKHTDLTCVSMVINYWGDFLVRQSKSNFINNERACVLYNCVIFPWKLCAPAFNLAFGGWLWYVDAGQHLGACSLNGAIWYNSRGDGDLSSCSCWCLARWLHKLTHIAGKHLFRFVSGTSASSAHLSGWAYISDKRRGNSFS